MIEYMHFMVGLSGAILVTGLCLGLVAAGAFLAYAFYKMIKDNV